MSISMHVIHLFGMCLGGGGGGGQGVAVGCYLFVSYPRCLLPSPYQCLCGSTYCTTFLWILFFMCNSHQPHHANKGKCVWKKQNPTKRTFSPFGALPIIFLSLWWMSLHQAPLYRFHSALRNDYDFLSLWLLSRRHPWFFFLFLFNGRFKSYENNSRRKCEFATYLSSSPPPPFLPAVLLYHWADWRGRSDTSPSSAHLSPNKESRLNAEQLPLFEIHITWERRRQSSFCLCPQLDSTPRACKLIKKLGGTISLTRWRAIVSWWCAWYSMRLHYDYNNPVFFFNTHTHTH